MKLIDKDSLVAEIDKHLSYYKDLQEEPVSEDLLDMSKADCKIQYANIESGIHAHAEDYSFNIESQLFNQLTKEQQELWRKEIEQAVISGGHSGIELARDKRYNENQEPVSNDLEEEIVRYIGYPQEVDEDVSATMIRKAARHFAQWQKETDKKWLTNNHKQIFNNGWAEGFEDGRDDAFDEQEEYVNKDLGDYINELSKQFPEVSFAKLSRIAVRVAKWQKANLWKPADGDDLPEIDREVIVLLDNGKVVFAHRPPEFWDGKNIITGKVTRNYPKTYNKGDWNIPNIKYWLDVELPKEI